MMIKSFFARPLHEAAPYGHYSRYTTVSLKLLEATISSCIVLPYISLLDNQKVMSRLKAVRNI